MAEKSNKDVRFFVVYKPRDVNERRTSHKQGEEDYEKLFHFLFSNGA